MSEPLPPGQGPIDPRGAFTPPPPPQGMPPLQPPMPPPYSWPGYYPVPMMVPPTAQRPAKSFTRAIFLTLATTLFSISLLLNIYLLLWAGITSSSSLSSSRVLVSGDQAQTVAVIPVTGMITGETFGRFDKMLREIESDPNIKALVIEIDTPGGEVTASDEIYHRLVQFRQAHPKVPVVASMRQLATSGGYYVACAADYLVAQPSTMTGNIGVLMLRFNISSLMQKWGIQDTTLHSTGADFKDAGSMFKPETPQETAYIQGLLDEAFAQFKKVVRTGREGKLTVSIEQAANGKVYMAGDALRMGLIDEVGYAEQAYAAASRLAGGLDRMNVVRYKESEGILGLLGVESTLQGGAGIQVSLDPLAIERMASPRMMYLWRMP